MTRAWCAVLLTACVGTQLPADLQQAQEREGSDPEAALAVYRAIQRECEQPGARPRRRDDCATALIRQAQLYETLARWPEASAMWLLVRERSTEPRRQARALVRAADIAEHQLHDATRALQLAQEVVTRWPDEVPSDDALKQAVRIAARGHRRETQAWLAALWPRVRATDLGDNVLWQLGLLLVDDDGEAALRTFDQLVAEYPRSGLRDDAIWKSVGLLRARRRFDDCLRHLRLILDSRRDALITGSYNSLYLDDAQLLYGQILLDDQHEAGRAAEAFAILADDYPESTLKDDALVELARAELARTPPRRDAACRALARLLKDYPDSNCRRRAEALQREQACAP